MGGLKWNPSKMMTSFMNSPLFVQHKRLTEWHSLSLFGWCIFLMIDHMSTRKGQLSNFFKFFYGRNLAQFCAKNYLPKSCKSDLVASSESFRWTVILDSWMSPSLQILMWRWCLHSPPPSPSSPPPSPPPPPPSPPPPSPPPPLPLHHHQPP